MGIEQWPKLKLPFKKKKKSNGLSYMKMMAIFGFSILLNVCIDLLLGDLLHYRLVRHDYRDYQIRNRVSFCPLSVKYY